MTTRMLSRTVTFRRPFVLSGFERVAPAGIYTVDTEEESIDDVSFVVWKRCTTVMHITQGGETEYVRIDPEDLRKALARDEAPEESESVAQARLADGRRRAPLARRKKY